MSRKLEPYRTSYWTDTVLPLCVPYKNGAGDDTAFRAESLAPSARRLAQLRVYGTRGVDRHGLARRAVLNRTSFRVVFKRNGGVWGSGLTPVRTGTERQYGTAQNSRVPLRHAVVPCRFSGARHGKRSVYHRSDFHVVLCVT